MANEKNRPPFRYDIVGSFLRPEALKKKREAFASGKISAAELKEAEDAAIRDLVAKEKEVGLKAVTDGEFRRRYWHLDFLAALGASKRSEQRNGRWRSRERSRRRRR